MVQPIFTDPRDGLAFLKFARQDLLNADPESRFVLEYRDQVLSDYGSLFRTRNQEITADEVSQFLNFSGNHHWTGLHRQKTSILNDMTLLRQAIAILVDRKPSGDDVGDRFDKAGEMIRGFGEGIMSAILFVSFPQNYSVWNAKSEFALRQLGLWIVTDRGESEGRKYEKVNAAILHAQKSLNESNEGDPIDLWTIDYCWHGLKFMHDSGKLNVVVNRFKQARL